jgi:hypothetical protein
MIAHTRDKWSQHDMSIAAEIWQNDFIDVHGDDRPPPGAIGKTIKKIAVAIDRSITSIERRLNTLGPGFGGGQVQRTKGASAFAIAEREARKEAAHRASLTAQIFGDPPPGYSALDRKRLGVLA